MTLLVMHKFPTTISVAVFSARVCCTLCLPKKKRWPKPSP